ncbi:MAG: hypothetical protein JW847_01775 [Candidatus Omnitrophica bacterium]|nr:hypothetical protein [Candidatus Omnitrophota bacterium]
MQGNYWSNDLTNEESDDLTLGFGVSWKLKPSLDLRIGYFQDIEKSSGEEDRVALLQIYYYGK